MEEKDISSEIKLLNSMKRYILYKNKYRQDLAVFTMFATTHIITNFSAPIEILSAISLLELLITYLKLRKSERIYEFQINEYNQEKILEKR